MEVKKARGAKEKNGRVRQGKSKEVCICGYCPSCNPLHLGNSHDNKCPVCSCYKEILPPGRTLNLFCPVHGQLTRK